MKKEVVVRKKRSQRLGVFFVFLLMLTLSIFATVFLYPLYYFGLLSIIGAMPALYIFLYYEIWCISFSAKEITVKCMFQRTRSYSYSQIVDGYIANSYTMYQHVSLTFCDKRKLRFRMEDENANRALKTIQSHYSLRSLNW